MNRIQKIRHDCRKATLLIEKEQFGKLGWREKIELRIHLAGCSVCRLFKQQSAVISRLVGELLGNNNLDTHATLPQDDKRVMQEKIEQAIGENNL